MSVESPEWRREVLGGLDVLAGEPNDDEGADGTLLETAVHAVVDDTFWDQPNRDPSTSIGRILVNEVEAAAVRRVVAAVCRVSERQGADARDAAWFADEEWPQVREAAGKAAAALRANGV
jgi:hypothetical protein